MKKQFQSLTEKGRWLLATLTLIFTLGIGQMWGAVTVETYNNSGAAKDGAIAKTGSTLPGNYDAGTGNTPQGHSESGSFKLRTQNTKVTLNEVEYGYAVITANSGYVLKSFQLDATSNSSNSITLYGVYVDVDASSASNLATALATATNQLSSNVVFPNKNTDYVSTPNLSINASSNIVLLFSGSGDNQLRAVIKVGYEAASSGPVDPTINTTNGAYTINGTALDLTTCVSSNNTTGAFSFAVKTDGDTDASIDGSSFTANYAGTCVVTATQAAVSGTWNQKSVDFNVVVSAATGKTDPTATFSNSDYTIGGTLDLSSLFESNSEGTVTYTITDAGTTSATLASDGKTFSATATGSATVKASQAATTAHNAIEKTATITVKAATPSCPDYGMIYKFQTKSSGLGTGNVCAATNTDYEMNVSNSLQTLEGGTLTARTSSTSQLKYNNNSFKFTGGSGGVLAVNMTCPIKAGDIIRYINSGAGSLYVRHTNSSTSTNQITLAGNGLSTIQTIVVPDQFADKKDLFIVRNSGDSYLEYFEVNHPYEITLNPVGGTITSTTIKAAGDDYIALPHPFKDSYAFAGWYNGENPVNDAYFVTGNVTLTAHYADCPTTGTLYSFQTKTGLADANIAAATGVLVNVNKVNYLSALQGGTMDVYYSGSAHAQIKNSAVYLNNNAAYIKVLMDCPIEEGDLFEWNIASSDMFISLTTTRDNSNTAPKMTSGEGSINVLSSNNFKSLIGKKEFYIFRNSSASISYFRISHATKYAVTYTAGAGSVKEGQSMPTQEATIEGGKFNTALGTALEKSGYDFAGWQWTDDESNTHNIAANTEFTMPAYPVTFVAQWTLHVDKYTVKYMDGEDLLDSEEVTVGEHPAGITNPTKALYTFVNWKNGDDDVNPTELDGTADQVITLQAQWTKAYASTVNFADDNNSGSLASFLPAGYACGGTFSNSEWGKESEGASYFGYKLKDKNVYVEFRVQANRRVTMLFGNYGATGTIKVGDADAENCTLTDSKYIIDTDAEKVIRFTTNATSGSTVTLKSITIGDIPTISDDATLSDLTLKYGTADAATISGFSSAKQTYYVEVPYGTAKADLPIVGATATDATNAKVTINQAKDRDDWKTVIRVQAEDRIDAHDKYYEVHFIVLPKQGVELIKATVSGGNQSAGFDAEGLYAGKGYAELASDKKMNTNNYVGVKLAAGKTFATGDVLYVATVSPSTSSGSQIEIYAEPAGTNLIWNTEQIDLTYGITLPAAFDGLNEFYIVRKTSKGAQAWNGYVNYVEVQRYMEPFIETFKIGTVTGSVDKDNKTIAIELPYNTSLSGVAATIEAYANGGATVTAPTPLAYDTPLGYKVSSAYAEDGDVDYTVTITEAEHYEAMIVGGANYETLVAAVAAAQADDVVKLLDNVDLMATGLTIAENITLDLNGFNIKAGEQIDNDIVVPAGKKLTLVDNSANAEGKIYTEQAYTGAVTGYGLVRVAGELLMQSGNIYAVIESDPANLGQFAVVVAPAGKVTVAGGQIKAGWYAISNSGNNTGSTIIVSGGELISTADFAIYNPAKESTVTVSGGVVYGAAGGIAMNRGELTVTGGTITSKDQGTTGTWGDGTGGLSNAAISASGKYESVEVEISGGTIIAEGTAVMITNGTTNPVEVAISGGQFSHVVPAEYCADGFAPVTTPNAQGKYEVIPVGIIHGPAVQDPTTEVYSYTLDNDVTIFSSESDGRLKTSNHIATSSDVVACGGDSYNVNKSAFVLQFPVNVKEFTLFGANSTERTISKVYVNAEASADIKISTVGRELTGAYSNTKDEKCQTLTAVFAGENIIPANEYVLVTLSGSVNFYRVLYTEAECTTPTVAVADQAAKENVAVTLTAEASALGATYQWYTCDDALGTNPVIMAGKTAKTLSVTKVGTADQYYKVVVGCNCSAETAEAVAKVSLYTEVATLVDVTENTVWDWTTVTNDVDGAAITSDGKLVNGTYGILANYLQGADWDKIEGNSGAYAIRSNTQQYYQGASLHMHTTKGGVLKINARNDGSTMNLKVANIDLGKMTSSFKDYVVYVPAGDVVIENVPVTAGKPMRVAKITFTVDETPDYTRTVSNNIGTLCVDHNVVAGGALGATFYQIASRNELYNYKIDFEEVLPNEELKAGEPYIFKSTTGRIDLYYGETVAAEPVPVRGMVGAYAEFTLDITDENKSDVLYIAQNKLWNCEDLVGTGLTVVENRAYIVMSEVPTYEQYTATPSAGAPRRRVTLGKDEAQVVTGFGELETSETPVKVLINGQIFIIRGEKMFDVTGKLVK